MDRFTDRAPSIDDVADRIYDDLFAWDGPASDASTDPFSDRPTADERRADEPLWEEDALYEAMRRERSREVVPVDAEHERLTREWHAQQVARRGACRAAGYERAAGVFFAKAREALADARATNDRVRADWQVRQRARLLQRGAELRAQARSPMFVRVGVVGR